MLGAVMLFVWKHSLSEKYKTLLSQVRQKQKLLQLITENQIQSMFLLDNENRIVFANKKFMKRNKIKNELDYINKPIENVIGTSLASEYISLSEQVHESGETATHMRKARLKDKGVEKYYQQKVIPIIPNKSNNHFKGCLIIENDISDLINERVKYEQSLNNSTEILVRIIENRSEYFRNHGAQVQELSLKIADNLGVPEEYRRAINIASRISNLSLALLPRDLLNKKGALTEDEKIIVELMPQKTVDMIRDFNFDSPVIETLEQVNERVDGSGPRGMVGDNIMISARIIKVVNDYVAMISERPYRAKLTSEQAIETLLKEKDAKYSKEVVFSLANIMS